MAKTPAAQLVEDARVLQNDHVTFWIRPDDDHPNRASLEQIWSERERGAGHASRAIRGILAHADRLGVDLTLQVHWLAYDPADAHPDYDELWELNAKKLDNRQLYDWYARLGFVSQGGLNTVDLEDGEQRMHRPAQPIPVDKPARSRKP